MTVFKKQGIVSSLQSGPEGYSTRQLNVHEKICKNTKYTNTQTNPNTKKLTIIEMRKRHKSTQKLG